MESIYYVMSWLCHRTCWHCYEERFRLYYGTELEAVVSEARTNFARIIANLLARLTYLVRDDPDGRGGFQEKIGRVILAGGEILLSAVREPVLYPAIALLRQKYSEQGGVKVVIQTTGDVVSARVLYELRHPERMGIQQGWSVEKFLEKSTGRLPSGRLYRNLCVGCDRFHEEVLEGCKSSLVSITH